MNKKYVTRRQLDMYSEEVFSKKLMKIGQNPFFPFKDKGVDIIGIDKNNKVYFYQLKARNLNLRYEEYWFMVNKKKLDNFPHTKTSFWVFCCFKSSGSFDFFVVPLKVVERWYNLVFKKWKKKEQYFLSIKPLLNGKYRLAPKWLNDEMKIQKYLIK